MSKLMALMLLAIALPAQAAISIFATVPEWAALAQEIGGDKVQAMSATTALQDPHHIDARPSLIARARNADLLIATGADLEVGWLPVIQRESGNPRIQIGKPGYFVAAEYVRMLDIPGKLDRAEGDVHAAGNPHIQTDPRNLLKIGNAMANRLSTLDPANADAYRMGYQAFAERWRGHIARWEKMAMPLNGMPVVSQHKGWPYLYEWLGIKEVATLEARPGVEPSVAHMARLKKQVATVRPRMVIRAAYSASRPAEWFAAEAKVPMVTLPFTVGGTSDAGDLTSMFDATITRLLKAVE